MRMTSSKEKLGLIAGNGKFPFLVLDAARAQGYEVVVAAIQEEAFPETSSASSRKSKTSPSPNPSAW